MLKTYLEEKIYREDDIDISRNSLANGYRCKVLLSQYRNQSITVDILAQVAWKVKKKLGGFKRNTMNLFFPFQKLLRLMSILSTLQIMNNPMKHFSKNMLPLKHLQIHQIRHSLVFREASHTFIKIFNFLFLVKE